MIVEEVFNGMRWRALYARNRRELAIDVSLIIDKLLLPPVRLEDYAAPNMPTFGILHTQKLSDPQGTQPMKPLELAAIDEQ